MFAKKIRINKDLYERLEAAASNRGYSSTQEFVEHALEKATETESQSESEEAVKERLRGLGYLE